ncbi:MAG: hypothetical protein JWN34_5527 [Bryobacterales bacterium]|nr:hypothetical protein [Bryobacterales bacterium]
MPFCGFCSCPLARARSVLYVGWTSVQTALTSPWRPFRLTYFVHLEWSR